MKRVKDKNYQLLKVIMDERPGDVLLVWEELRQRGSGWVKRVGNALTASSDEYQEVFEKAAAAELEM